MTTPPPTARAAGALRTLLRWSPLVVPIALPLAWSPSREWSAGLVVLGYLGFCALSWHRHRRAAAATPADALPVAYASQGGQARRLAERSAEQLRQAGLDACAVPLEALSVERLARLPRLLIVASTYGDGEAPDHAAGFLRLLARHRPDLAGLDYALLALGDSTYRHFCGFARQLDDRLRALGARPRHDRLEADRLDAGVLRRWQLLEIPERLGQRRHLVAADPLDHGLEVAGDLAIDPYRLQRHHQHAARQGKPPDPRQQAPPQRAERRGGAHRAGSIKGSMAKR